RSEVYWSMGCIINHLFYNRDIRRRPVVLAKLIYRYPPGSHMFFAPQLATGYTRYKWNQLYRAGRVGVLHRLPSFCHFGVHMQLFLNFAYNGPPIILARLHLATRKLPFQRQVHGVAALADQYLAVLDDDGTGNDEHSNNKSWLKILFYW